MEGGILDVEMEVTGRVPVCLDVREDCKEVLEKVERLVVERGVAMGDKEEELGEVLGSEGALRVGTLSVVPSQKVLNAIGELLRLHGGYFMV